MAEPLVEGLPAPGTIRWRVAHLEHCARHYSEILRKRPIAVEPTTAPPGMTELPELIERLESARRFLRDRDSALERSGFGSPLHVRNERWGVRANGGPPRSVARWPACGYSEVASTSQRTQVTQQSCLVRFSCFFQELRDYFRIAD